ncbi:hypothetical protein ACWD25_49065, partial [Streptomyces sp. NPDC002920]
MERLYLKSPNAVRYTLLTEGCLLLAGDLGTDPHLRHGSSTANTWAQRLLVLITTDIYWNSAWNKLRSPQFRSGLHLAQWVHVYTQVREQLPYRRRYAIPSPVRRNAENLTFRDIQFLADRSGRRHRHGDRPATRDCSSRRPRRTPSPPASPCTSLSPASSPAGSSPSPDSRRAPTSPSPADASPPPAGGQESTRHRSPATLVNTMAPG